ncbi:MAG: glycosyltransferase family 9 protein [Pyrinomonadaceae bacterium]|nr:glycosyltransferase family 9 protein [Pyrinomonadaceae bacterium]MCX7640657.1 glycosyltransferase family 9 protein [Pyrinomonadaceae bacterium]MDW8305066.1 glycosyltransferase family 9 protein [Acidobacteriota bacterium]
MRILVYRIGGIGDMIIALPALWAIRKAFPDADIVYLTDLKGKTERTVRELLPEEVYDDLICYAKFSEIVKILGKSFDAVFYLMNRNRDVLRIKRDKLFFRLVARKVYGIKHLEKVRLLDRKFKHVCSEYDYLLDCLYEEEELKLPPRESLRPDLKLKESERNRASKWIRENTDGNLIAVMASSAWSSKNWKEERFAEVVYRLIRKRDVFPLVFGGVKEREQADRLVNFWGRGRNLAGKFGLRMDAAIIERCKLYLGNDTGTMHLASAVGTRCVAIFSAIDHPGRWDPFGQGHKIIRKRVFCEICYQRACPREFHECMELVSTEEVYRACIEVLDEVNQL